MSFSFVKRVCLDLNDHSTETDLYFPKARSLFYGDKSRAMSQPTATRFVQINTISAALLLLNV